MPRKTPSTLREEADAIEARRAEEATTSPRKRKFKGDHQTARVTKPRSKGEVEKTKTGPSAHNNSVETRHDNMEGNISTKAKTREKKYIQFNEVTADIFDAPDHAVLIHACNTQGSWGAGIAKAFKVRYPKAFTRYKKFCKENDIKTGCAFLIAPCEGDGNGPKHWVGCVFTSAKYGMKVDSPQKILEATGPAMKSLLKQVADARRRGEEVSELRMCKINSGLFKVAWKDTQEVIEALEVEKGVPEEITVFNDPKQRTVPK